jgi:hypothetical protein
MAFPIKATKHDKVGDGFHITTEVTVSANGRVDGGVRLENYNNLQGFKGGSVVLLGDANGNIVWGSKTHKTGVNATGFSRKSTAVEDWEETVPSGIIGSVALAEIVNKATPDDNLWKQRIDDAIAVTKKIADVVNELS